MPAANREGAMIARRELLGGTVLGGWLGRGAGADAAGAPQDRMDVSGIVDRLDELRKTIASSREFTEIAQVRARQKEYLKRRGRALHDRADGDDAHHARRLPAGQLHRAAVR